MYGDNEAAQLVTNDGRNHSRVKMVDIKYHIVQDYVRLNLVTMVHCKSRDNLANIGTKILGAPDFIRERQRLGMSKMSEDHTSILPRLIDATQVHDAASIMGGIVGNIV